MTENPPGPLPLIQRRSKWENAVVAFAFLCALHMVAALLAALVLYTSYLWDEVGYVVTGFAVLLLALAMAVVSARLRTWWWLVFVTGALLLLAIAIATSSEDFGLVISLVSFGLALSSAIPILLGAQIARRRASAQLEPAGSSASEKLLHL